MRLSVVDISFRFRMFGIRVECDTRNTQEGRFFGYVSRICYDSFRRVLLGNKENLRQLMKTIIDKSAGCSGWYL